MNVTSYLCIIYLFIIFIRDVFNDARTTADRKSW
jgi:hypothetical protein